jgi:ribosomal protein S18 acetylase RimI-like enzyme
VKTEQYLKEAVSRLFNQEELLCLVIPKGNRLIAASLLDPAVDTLTHLVSGPAVLVEYRNRGIGSRLLHASLAALRSSGLSSVKGITRANSVASRYVYSKFGGSGEEFQLSPQNEGIQEAKA